MFGSFNPLQPVPLTVVTAQLVIQGTLRTRLRRLTDVLNEPDAEHLVLFEAMFMEVGSRRIAADSGVAQIPLADVLFVHSTDPTESTDGVRTPKQPIQTIVLVPPFTIEGQIHLPYESELHQALDAFAGRFVPITAARYWAKGEAESPTYADLLVVNHSRAHVAVPASVEWLREALPATDAAGAQNPW